MLALFEDLSIQEGVIDGEIVVLDDLGRPSFRAFQHLGCTKRDRLLYFAFDLLNLEGKSLLSLPLIERRRLLETALAKCPPRIRFTDFLESALGSKYGLSSVIAPSSTRKKSKIDTTAFPSFEDSKVASHNVATHSPPTMCRSTFAPRTGIFGKTSVFRNRVGIARPQIATSLQPAKKFCEILREFSGGGAAKSKSESSCEPSCFVFTTRSLGLKPNARKANHRHFKIERVLSPGCEKRRGRFSADANAQ
jgi:hypothetical protein